MSNVEDNLKRLMPMYAEGGLVGSGKLLGGLGGIMTSFGGPWMKAAGAGLGLLGLLRGRRRAQQNQTSPAADIPDHPFTGQAPQFPSNNYQHGIQGEYNYFPSYKQGGLVGYNNGGLTSLPGAGRVPYRPHMMNPMMPNRRPPMQPQTRPIPMQALPRSYAEGGMVGMDGAAGAIPPMPPQQPPMAQEMQPPQVDPSEDQNLIGMTIAAIQGQVPNPEQIIQVFVARFGQKALMDLIQRISGETPNGDGMSDSIPAMQDGGPAALSEGEFVMPADVVSGLGNGSTQAGAQQLEGMMNRVREAKGASMRQPPAIEPGGIMPM